MTQKVALMQDEIHAYTEVITGAKKEFEKMHEDIFTYKEEVNMKVVQVREEFFKAIEDVNERQKISEQKESMRESNYC